MNKRSCVRRLGRSLTLLAWSLGALSAGLARGDDAGKYEDSKYHFSLTVPDGWKAAALKDYSVPGVARSAWSGPRGASIVAFVQEPGQAVSPRFLVDESARAMREKLGAKVVAQEVKAVGGKQAMWLVVEGKGNGGAITGEGDTETTQHWVAIPREEDIVVVLLTCPSHDYDAYKKPFEKAVAAMMVGGEQTREQKESR